MAGARGAPPPIGTTKTRALADYVEAPRVAQDQNLGANDEHVKASQPDFVLEFRERGVCND